MNFTNWQVNVDDNQVYWLLLDKHGTSTNTIDQSVLRELETIIDDIATKNDIKAVVIKSAKKNGFVFGADINQFGGIEDIPAAEDFIRYGQKVFLKLEKLPCNTIAVIHGYALGGGMELALACKHRIILDSGKMGLPEVKLGIQPGWGGTVRLPRLIGGINALSLFTSGRTLSGKQAQKMGVVDACVPERTLDAAIDAFINNPPKPHQPTKLQELTNNQFVRPIIGKIVTAQIAKKIKRQHYPASFAMVDTWVENGPYGDNAYEVEAQGICSLFATPTCHNLLRVFALQNKLKSLAKGVNFDAKRVHVIGAGVMGGNIAIWCALQGFIVTLQDNNPQAIARTFKEANKLFTKKLKQQHLVTQALDRLIPDVKGTGVANADVIIEAIVENKDAKASLFKQLEAKAKPTAVLATNTSTIPLAEIGAGLKNPDRVVGIHFFNPVAKMPLIEVVYDDNTSEEMQGKALLFARKLDKLPLPVKSSPGFLVNRILMPYLMESMALVEEGVHLGAIDKAALDFGMPMGPIELADTVGLDVCLNAATKLSESLGGSVPARLKQMVEQGKLGVKSGQGFYNYVKGKKQKQKLPASFQAPQDITDRLIMRMLNESIACLRENIVTDADLLDAGMIFGAGFPPFRGGPVNYIKTEGSDRMKEQLVSLEQKYGERFSLDAGWDEWSAA